MSFSFSARPSVPLAVLLTFLALAGVAACGSTKASNTPGASTTPDASSACLSPPLPDPDGGVAPYEGFASGSAKGPTLSASLCNAEILASAPNYGGGSSPVTLTLDSTASFSTTTIRVPTGTVAGTLSGTIQLPSPPTAGVYKSSDSQACGSLTFSYGILDDGGGASCNVVPLGGACPSGCATIYFCRDAATEPCCVPLATTYVYQASTGTNCFGSAQTAAGSWALTLTGITLYQEDAGPYEYEQFYVAHGTLTASLQGTTGVTDMASVSVSF